MWWIQYGLKNDRKQGGCSKELYFELTKKNYRTKLWRWGRKQIGRKELTVSERLAVWSLVERFRLETFSSHDAVKYYALMTGMSRNSFSKAINGLIGKGIIKLVKEAEEGKVFESLERGGRRHFLFVGLAYEFGKAGRERATNQALYLGERARKEAQEIGRG